jgi:DNA polymerase I-like protein with 3'-5' exonuclease and polymerase domains
MIISNESDIQKVLNFIDSNDELAYDIETTSLNPRTGAIVGIGITTATDGFYLLQSAWNGESLEDVLPREAIISVLNKLKSKKLYGWNFSFDSRFTYHFYGVDLIESVYCDGMLAKHTANENAFSYALKETAAELYGAEATQEQQAMQASIKANGGTTYEYFKADPTLLGLYCLQDCKLTIKISQH